MTDITYMARIWRIFGMPSIGEAANDPMTITIPPEALEAAARRAVLFNGGDPDKQLRLTLQGKTIAQWEQVAPLIEAACIAMLESWPGMLIAAPDSWVRCRRDGPTTILPMSNGNIILPFTENTNERE